LRKTENPEITAIIPVEEAIQHEEVSHKLRSGEKERGKLTTGDESVPSYVR
jgi:hypothetical protein